MVKNIFLTAAILWSFTTIAQVDNRPPYLQFPTIPPFTIRLVPDSISFSKHDLKKRTAVMIFMFSPDCDHCHHATRELIENIRLFKKVQIIMVSSLDFKLERAFYDSFKIADHPNIKVGRDPNYFLGSFYKISSFPSIFLYDKKGKFIKGYESPASLINIAADL